MVTDSLGPSWSSDLQHCFQLSVVLVSSYFSFRAIKYNPRILCFFFFLFVLSLLFRFSFAGDSYCETVLSEDGDS